MTVLASRALPQEYRFEEHKSASGNLLLKIGKLRVEAWKATPDVTPNTFPLGVWLDNHDTHAWHWIGLRENQIVASARMCLHQTSKDFPDLFRLPNDHSFFDHRDFPVACFNRLVVHPTDRLNGLASLLDRARLQKANELGANSVLVRAGSRRIPSLQKLGFIKFHEANTDLITPNYKESFMFLSLRTEGLSPAQSNRAF